MTLLTYLRLTTLYVNLSNIRLLQHKGLVLLLVLLGYSNALLAQWEKRDNGIFGAEVRAFAVNDNYFFAGTYGAGVFRSADHGSSWQEVNNGITNDNISSLLTHGSYVYAGTDDGVFRSSDNGNTWTRLTVLSLSGRVYALYAANGYLFVSGNNTYRSTDNGETWEQANLGLPVGGVRAFAAKGSVLYVANGGVYKSFDNGETWENTGLGGGQTTCIIVSGNDLFAGGSFGVYQSSDDGSNWINVKSGGVSHLMANAGYLFASGDGVFRSGDNGNTWTTINTGFATTSEYRTFYALGADDINIYVGGIHYSTTGGISTQFGSVYRSANNGANWVASNTGLTGIGVTCFVSDGGYLFAGTNETGMFRSGDNGLNWISVNAGLTNLKIRALAIGNGFLFAATWGGGVFRSANQGSTWEAVNTGLFGTYIRSIAVSGSRLLAGTAGSGVYRSDDNGVNWTASNAGITSPSHIYAFAIKEGYVFAAQGGTIYRSTNNGTSWPASFSIFSSYSSVITMMAKGNDLYSSTTRACCDGSTGLFRSTNNGDSWGGINTGFISSPTVTSIDENDDVLYIGVSGSPSNNRGVYASANNGSGWIPVGEGLLTNLVQAVHVHNSYLFAGTNAGGIYAIPLIQSLPVPVISSFSPTSGAPGTSVVITGSNFASGVTHVSFNGSAEVSASVTAENSLTVLVPTDAISGKITVSVAGVSAISSTDFTVNAQQPVQHPPSFSATTFSHNQINLSFTAPSSLPYCAGYLLLRRQDGTAPTVTGIEDGVAPALLSLPAGTTLAANITTTSATSFENTGLTPATQYYYLIIPYNVQSGQGYNYLTGSGLKTANAYTRAAEPSAQPTALAFTNVSASSMDGSFTAAAGSPAGYLVVRRAGAAPTTPPVDGTPYTAGATLGDGTVVSSGSGTTFTSTGLAATTVYYYAVYAYNGSGVTLNYREASPLQGNRSTVAAQPSTQASNISFPDHTPTSLTVSWTNGNGAERLVIAREGSAVSVNPAGGTTYTGNANFLLAADLGAGNKVVYRGTANSVAVTNLTPGTEYFFRVYELNGTAELTSYQTNTASGNPNSRIQLQAEPSAHPATFTATSVSNTQVSLSFSPASAVTNGFGYIILRRQDGSNPSVTGITDSAAPASLSFPTGTTLITNITSSSQTTHTDGGLTTGTQYSYLIVPYNGNSTGTYNYKTDGTLRTASATPTASGTSDIVAASFTYPVNIPYQNYQSTDLTIANSVEAGRFTIRDGGEATDADNSPTVLTSITFSIVNGSFIRSVALYDGAIELGEAAPVGGTVSFTGLNLSAPDNSSKIFSVRVSFNAEVTDNAQFSFTVTSATAQVGNSGFAAANAGGAVTSTAGDNNRIEVTAAKIVYTVQPPPLVGVNTDVSPAPALDALDALNNKDLDYASAVTVSNSASLTMINTPAAFSSGTLTFPNNFRFTAHGTATLTVASGSLTGATSSSVVVRAAEPSAQPTVLTFNPNTITATSMEGSFSAASGNPADYLVLRKAGSAPTEIPEDGTAYAGTFGTSTVVHNGSGTSFSSTGLTAGTVYHYAVYAYNGSGQTINYLTANPLTNSGLTRPAAPTVTLSNATSSNFNAEWTVVPSATGYKLDVSLNNSFNPNLSLFDAKPVTGTFENVTGLQAATQYFVRVRAVNASGESVSSETKQITTQSFSGGSPIAISNGTPIAQSSGTLVSVTLTGGEGTRTVRFYSRGIRTETFTSITSNPTGNTYQVTVPHTDLDELGLEYYFEASDASGTASTAKAYIHKPVPAGTSIPNLSFGGKAENYRIISIPYKLNQSRVSDIFPATWVGDKKKMRFVHYTSSGYADFSGSIVIGRGYWFNAKEQHTATLGEGTVSPNYQTNDFIMSLQEGWNMIATPYPFVIGWSDILDENPEADVDPVYYVFNPTINDYDQSNSLKPFEGGFIFANNSTTLNIPVTLKNSAGGRKKDIEEFEVDLDAENWLVPIKIKQGNTENTRAGVGMHTDAKLSKDRLDRIALPGFLNYAELTSYHPEFFSPNFSRDVVPPQQSYVWPFILEASGSEPVTIQWDNESIQHSKAQLLLYDAEAGRLVDMRTTGIYTVPNANSRQLQFIFNTNPDNYRNELGTAYPNPFTRRISLPAYLNTVEGQASVMVSIVNLTGIEVHRQTLTSSEKGLLQPEWDGTDQSGNSVSPGVYVYKVTFNKGSRTYVSQGKVVKL